MRSVKNIVHTLLIIFSATSIDVTDSLAFDYLEHMYLTDQVCQHTLHRIEQTLLMEQGVDEDLLTRYLALSLFCPKKDASAPYCEKGVKLATAPLTALSAPPADSGEYSLTLGDITSLPDHIAHFGTTPNLPRAGEYGLTSMILEWISAHEGGVTGTLYDVAEDACEEEKVVDWSGVTSDISSAIETYQAHHRLPTLPVSDLRARARAPLSQGPKDPAALYSFDNPHYLDLIFRNHHHFGDQAYAAWLGFHSVGIDLSKESCPSLITTDPDDLEELADDWPIFEDMNWSAYSIKERQQRGCDLLSHIINLRLTQWSKDTSPTRLAELKRRYPKLSALLSLNDHTLNHSRQKSQRSLRGPKRTHIDDSEIRVTKARRLSHALLSASLSLIYEASGLHFLQDCFAGGHMRTIRTRGGLQESRYDHDADNRDGVIATYYTAKHSQRFVAYGDTYLLGAGPTRPPSVNESDASSCSIERSSSPHPDYHGARCALQVQRGLISLATMSSLLDWAYGGLMYRSPQEISTLGEDVQNTYKQLSHTLPIAPPLGSAINHSDHLIADEPLLKRANLPVPPPDFSYQVLSHRFAFDITGKTTRLGLQLTLLDTLGQFAHWLSSYRFGLYADLGEGDLNRWSVDGGYTFHFRWAARFTVDMGLGAHSGWREFNQGLDWYVGLTPFTGLTLLPEGWIKMPLEFTLSYQLPLTFYDQGVGFPGYQLIDGHYFGIGLGLAFMK